LKENKWNLQINLKAIGQICFWIAVIMELVIVIIDKSAYTNPLEGQLFRITFLLFCIKIATTKYTRNEWICILVFGILAMISYLVNEKDEVVRLVAFIAACKDIPLGKNTKVVFYVTLVGCVILILLSVTGIYGSTAMIADFGRCVVEKRYTLGMGHPNALHCMIWVLMVLYIYIYHNSMKIYHYIVCFAINIAVYYLTDSNTGLIIGTFTLILAVIMQYAKNLQDAKWVYILAGLVIVGCIIFTILGAMFGDGVPVLYEIDDMINGRYKSAFVFEDARFVNWKLFSSPDCNEFFDAGFIRIVYWYGIIPAMLYLTMNYFLIYQAYKYKDYMLMVMVVVFSIYTLMEAHFISVYLLRNYLFVIMGYYWYQPFEGKGDYEGYFWQIKGLLTN
jgi:hypothetical protein